MSRWRVLFVIGAFAAMICAVAGPSHVRQAAADAPVCSPLPHAAGNVSRTVVSGGIARTYEMHVPPGYDGTTPLPLVLNFHGLGSQIIEQVFVSDLYPRADAQTFLVATLQGRQTAALTSNHWNNVAVPTITGEADDVLFASQVIDDVAAQVCLDVSRVYSTGMSNGAQMTVRLGCSLSRRIAAIAPVAGVYFPPMSTSFIPDESCPDTRPMPIVAFHGTNDPTIPFDGGPGARGYVFRDVDDVVIPAWVARNGCASGPATSVVAPGVRLTSYSACAGNAEVQLYAVFDYDGDGPNTLGGGHIWPGSPYMPSGSTNAIEATDLMLAFFFQHTLPCAGGDGDCDSVADGGDNCPANYNPGQQNTDGNVVDLPNKAYDDVTQPNSDTAGDACDADADNDGRLDSDEAAGLNCPSATAPTDPRRDDTDGDTVLDGAECTLRFDPAVANPLGDLVSACMNYAPGDADGDGLPAFREFCMYGTSDLAANSDGDTCGDGRELASINADHGVDAIDLSQVAQSFGPSTSPKYAPQLDFTRDRSINATDLSQVAQRFGPCP